MTPELFSDAMNEIGAKYVEEALTYKRPAQRSFWSKLAKRAAMVALVALLALSGFARRIQNFPIPPPGRETDALQRQSPTARNKVRAGSGWAATARIAMRRASRPAPSPRRPA